MSSLLGFLALTLRVMLVMSLEDDVILRVETLREETVKVGRWGL